MKSTLGMISVLFILLYHLEGCSENTITPEVPVEPKITQLTHYTGRSIYEAKVFPNKIKLLYWMSNSSNFEIRSCEIDGGNDKLLLFANLPHGITISNDGKKLAFADYEHTSNGFESAIYIYELETDSLTKVYGGDDPGYLGETTPYAFSPNNSKLLVNVHHSVPGAVINSVGVLTINIKHLTILTGDISSNPIAFSPSGQEILYQTQLQLCQINSNGTDNKVLADQFNNIYCKGYSNDNNTVYFTGAKLGEYYAHNIYKVNLDGSNLTKITHDSLATYIADVSSNNQFILYNSNKRTRDLKMDVYKADLNNNIKSSIIDRFDDRAVGFANTANKIFFIRYEHVTSTSNLYLYEDG